MASSSGVTNKGPACGSALNRPSLAVSTSSRRSPSTKANPPSQLAMRIGGLPAQARFNLVTERRL